MNEYELGLKFEKYLNSEKKNIFKFNNLFKEIEAFQGIPDYIGVQIEEEKICRNFIDIISVEKWSTESKILACLKNKRYNTVGYLETNTGLSKNTLQKELLNLSRKKIVMQNEHGSYTISEKYYIPEMKIYSFELKLDNWKRALFQAIRYKTFSEYTYVVMPSDKKELLKKKIDIFKENNIGILLFDTKNDDIEVLYRARKNEDRSKSHSYYIKGKLLLENENKKHVSGNIRIMDA